MSSTQFELANAVSSLALLFVMVVAVRQDLVQHRISNVLTFGALAAGLAIHSLMQGLEGSLHALAGAAVGFACLLPLYVCKGMGAGDVKLMTAAGAFLGPLNAFVAALLSLAVGGVLAVAVVVWRMYELRTAITQAGAGTDSPAGFRFALAQRGKERFPYAIAIALGVVATMWLNGMLQPLLGSLA